MVRRLASFEERILPRDRIDVVRQLLLFAAAYGLYEITRGLVGTSGTRPHANALRIIRLEHSLHIFVEPRIERWVSVHSHWLLVIADWTYVNAHFTLTLIALAFIYLRRNESFYFVRNMFLVAMGIALIGYTVYPTAPPRLMPTFGFTDPVQQFTGVTLQHGAASVLFNPYAAVPSMHVCVALMIGVAMSRLISSRVARALWLTYPLFITFVVVATGNHYFTDVVLGGVTAGVAAVTAKRLLARARPDAWAFRPATATVQSRTGSRALGRAPA
jgi:membrane-associated phospholipid phosphatase